MISEFPQPERLPKPVKITEQTWPDGTVPVVSIFCITYNHAKFIRDAIEGFLMQETTFPVEIFIHDDASTDGTALIVQEYADKYPRLFWTVLQTENQWSQFYARRGIFEKEPLGMGDVLNIYLNKQRGEFIAMCEGDDYWTDALKLEKQVSFLREKRSFAGVFHRCRVVDETKRVIVHPWDQSEYKSYYTQRECLLELRSAYPTASLVFRGSSIRGTAPPAYCKEAPCDHTLEVHLTESGDLAFMDFEASAYRIHAGGAWSSSTSLQQRKMFARRFLAFLGDPELRRRHSRELTTALFKTYEFLWWRHYTGGVASWLRSYMKVLCLFPRKEHFLYFAEYSITPGSVVRFTLLDSIKGVFCPRA